MIQQQKTPFSAHVAVSLALMLLLGACSELEGLRRYVSGEGEPSKPLTTSERAGERSFAESRTSSNGKPPVFTGRPIRTGYACCNLRYGNDTIAESAYGQTAFLAAGTPMAIRRIEGARIDIEVGGKAMRIQADPSRPAASIEAWVNRLVVPEDPRSRIASWPASVQSAIALGQLSKGMTREQVSIALGPPPGDTKPEAESAHWRYWWANYVPVYIHWNKGGTLARVTGPAEAVNALNFRGDK